MWCRGLSIESRVVFLSLTIRIDPDLAWGTFLGDGGNSEYGYGITVDDSDSIYVTGLTLSATNYDTWDVFVSKLSNSGGHIWSTYVGGEYADIARALGGWSEVVSDPAEVGPAILRAKNATEDGNGHIGRHPHHDGADAGQEKK